MSIEYRKNNREKINERARQYQRENKERFRESKKKYRKQYRQRHKKEINQKRILYLESCKENFLKNLIMTTYANDRQIGREFDIDLSYILELWELQNGKCNTTGIKMICKFGDLKCVSIDRIDSNKGHIKGNVQLVCSFYNMGKKDKPDYEARAIIQEIRLNLLRELKTRGYLKLENTHGYF